MLYLRFGQQSAHGTPWCQVCPRNDTGLTEQFGRVVCCNCVTGKALYLYLQYLCHRYCSDYIFIQNGAGRSWVHYCVSTRDLVVAPSLLYESLAQDSPKYTSDCRRFSLSSFCEIDWVGRGSLNSPSYDSSV